MTAAPILPQLQLDGRAPIDTVRAFLGGDRLTAAYALADLDPVGGDRARWWLARRGDDPIACVLLVEQLPFRPCFATGEPEAVSWILREGVAESRLIVATPPASRLAVESVFRFERVDRMYRMAVDVSSFRTQVAHRVLRLGPDRLADMIDLYGNASRSYFTTTRLQRETYFGIYAGSQLVAAAGTHVHSATSGIAAVGNVLTRIAYRGRGMAASVTSAVTESALEDHRDVVLNVRQDNQPAISVYTRLGYRIHAPFVEGPAIRRSGLDRIRQIFEKREPA